MPVRGAVAPGVTANWTPDTNGHVVRCHCGANAVITAPPLCTGHAQAAVVNAGVTQRHHHRLQSAAQALLDVIWAADGGGYHHHNPGVFIDDLRDAAAHLRDQVQQ